MKYTRISKNKSVTWRGCITKHKVTQVTSFFWYVLSLQYLRWVPKYRMNHAQVAVMINVMISVPNWRLRQNLQTFQVNVNWPNQGIPGLQSGHFMRSMSAQWICYLFQNAWLVANSVMFGQGVATLQPISRFLRGPVRRRTKDLICCWGRSSFHLGT